MSKLGGEARELGVGRTSTIVCMSVLLWVEVRCLVDIMH